MPPPATALAVLGIDAAYNRNPQLQYFECLLFSLIPATAIADQMIKTFPTRQVEFEI
jgi:hypothetical protein